MIHCPRMSFAFRRPSNSSIGPLSRSGRNWKLLVTTPFPAYEKNDFRQKQQDGWYAAMDALVSAQISAWHQWRSMLHSGQLVPCIRDPDKGVILELDKGGW